jgi:phage terminase large subunit-like protein
MPRPRTKIAKADPGQEAVDFINSLTHTGDYSGVPFRLRPWQEIFVRRLFGTLRPDGRRQYRKMLLAIPRKQGKTELAAAIILYLLLGTGKHGQQLYSASGTKEQAALTYMAASTMVRNDEKLSAVCHLYDSYKKITLERLGSYYESLSSDAPTQHGRGPSAVIFDELHVFPNRRLFTALTSGFGGRQEPLTIMITTAGHDRHSLCYEQWQYARDVRDGRIDDPTFLPVLYETDGETDDWTDEATWRKAMPALGDFCNLEFIQDECKTAQNLPAYQNTFRQLYLNQWTEQAVRWLSTVDWTACGGELDAGTLRGRPCYGGLDLGVTGDMSAYAMLFPDDDGGYCVLMHFWVPRYGKWRDELRNQDRYTSWAQQGWLTFTEGNTADHQQIEDEIVALNDIYPLRSLFADRAYATQILSRLLNIHGLPVKGISQSPTIMSEPLKKLEELVLAREVRHGDNPILAWNVANAVVSRTRTGLMCLDKEQAAERIDGLAALLDALAAAIPDAEEESVYQTRGILVV